MALVAPWLIMRQVIKDKVTQPFSNYIVFDICNVLIIERELSDFGFFYDFWFKIKQKLPQSINQYNIISTILINICIDLIAVSNLLKVGAVIKYPLVSNIDYTKIIKNKRSFDITG